MKLKILHLGYSDNYGGASIAMNRINESLALIESIDSKIAVVKPSENPAVINLSVNFLEKIWAYLRVRLAYKLVNIFQKTSNKSGRSINIFSSTVLSRLKMIEFDILHLHWIGNETIPLEDLLKLKKPIVWTFHDKWAMLGAEHTEINNSYRFIEGYSNLNKPYDSMGLDIDKWVWERKKKIFGKVKIIPVAVSSWLALEVKKSFIWKNSHPQIINNPINVEAWKIKDKNKCKEILKISQNQKVIVFGAVNCLSDELKGFNNLKKAILKVSEKCKNENFTLLIFGDPIINEVKISNNLTLKSVGTIRDFDLLNTIYCSGELVVVPSYVETFGQVALEAISCGVPVVSFKTSGLLDIIIDNENGLFCTPFDSNHMAMKIIHGLSIKWDRFLIKNRANEKFGYFNIAKQYEVIYKKIYNTNEFI